MHFHFPLSDKFPGSCSLQGSQKAYGSQAEETLQLGFESSEERGCARIPLSPSLAYQGQSREQVQVPSGLCGRGQARRQNAVREQGWAVK